MIFTPLISTPLLVLLAIAFLGYAVFMFVNKEEWSLPLRRVLILVLMLIIIMRPQIKVTSRADYNIHRNVFFALDLSDEMNAQDSGQESKIRRYEKAKNDILQVSKHFKDAKFELITQDFDTQIALALNDNSDNLENALAKLQPAASDLAKPSASDDLIKLAIQEVEQRHNNHPEEENYIFVFSRGGFNNITLQSLQNENLFSGAIFGYGSNQGSFVNKINLHGEQINALILNENGANKLSKINEEKLETMARKLGLEYQNVNNVRLDDKIIERSIANGKSNLDNNNYADVYWLVAIVLFLILLLDAGLVLKEVLRERERKS